MIALDTSAVVAILEDEQDAERFAQAIEADDAPIMSVATFVELNAVMWHKRGASAVALVDRFMAVAGVTVEPLTAAQAVIARDAYIRFSALNFGDSYAYALARDKGVLLLFKGNDFSRTDVLGCPEQGGSA